MPTKLNFKKPTKTKFYVSWVPVGYSLLDFLNDLLDPEYPFLFLELQIIKLESLVIELKVFSRLFCSYISFFPTFGQCKLAPLLGIVLLASSYKREITIKLLGINRGKWLVNFRTQLSKKYHDTGQNITKQLNDKERFSAAIENAFIRLSVLKCKKIA